MGVLVVAVFGLFEHFVLCKKTKQSVQISHALTPSLNIPTLLPKKKHAHTLIHHFE